MASERTSSAFPKSYRSLTQGLHSRIFIFIFFVYLSTATLPTSLASPLQLNPLPQSLSPYRPFQSSSTNALVASQVLSPAPTFDADNWTPFIFLRDMNPNTPQGSASDGGGKNFNAPAAIWVVFCLGVGGPMAFAGFRGWMISTGVAAGLAGCAAAWTAIVNSIGPDGTADLVIELVALGFFLLGFAFGVVPFGRYTGIFFIGFLGGVSFGVRIAIIRPGLLFNGDELYKLNWIVVVIFGIGGGIAMIFQKTQRWALLLGCASIGTFLTFLGADLIIHKQSGMSRGLRLLFDRNNSHFKDLGFTGYHPSLTVMILIAVSLGSTPVLGVVQGLIFKGPFDRRKKDDEEDILEDSVDGTAGKAGEPPKIVTTPDPVRTLPPPAMGRPTYGARAGGPSRSHLTPPRGNVRRY